MDANLGRAAKFTRSDAAFANETDNTNRHICFSHQIFDRREAEKAAIGGSKEMRLEAMPSRNRKASASGHVLPRVTAISMEHGHERCPRRSPQNGMNKEITSKYYSGTTVETPNSNPEPRHLDFG